MPQALELIFRALKNGSGGEIFVPKLQAYKVGDMKDAILELLKSNNETQTINVRPGEKYHESLISKDEIRNTFEDKEDYILFDKSMRFPGAPTMSELKESTLKDQYSSDKVELLTKEELKKVLIKENLIPIKS